MRDYNGLFPDRAYWKGPKSFEKAFEKALTTQKIRIETLGLGDLYAVLKTLQRAQKIAKRQRDFDVANEIETRINRARFCINQRMNQIEW